MKIFVYKPPNYRLRDCAKMPVNNMEFLNILLLLKAALNEQIGTFSKYCVFNVIICNLKNSNGHLVGLTDPGGVLVNLPLGVRLLLEVPQPFQAVTFRQQIHVDLIEKIIVDKNYLTEYVKNILISPDIPSY